jgi:hypothetical protein
MSCFTGFPVPPTRATGDRSRAVDGIVVPATRMIYGYEDDHQVVREPVLVAITLDELAFS